MECKRLLTHALKFSREQGDDHQRARTSEQLSDVHFWMRLFKGGIQRAKEASEVYERLGDTVGQVGCLIILALLLRDDEQLDDAEEVTSRASDPSRGRANIFGFVNVITLLEKYIVPRPRQRRPSPPPLKVALGTATPFNWLDLPFWIRHCVARLFSDEASLDDAHAHVEQPKLHATNGNNTYVLTRAMQLQAGF